MRLLLAAPTSDDLIRLLKAWRFWLLGAVAGALIGTVVYLVAPPSYRARATVNVDFHLEQAWPQNTDREQFYYLERETRKLEEIAMSDAVLNAVVSQVGGVTLQELRTEKLQLSQPGNGGWHFFADDRDPRKAERLVAGWAQTFAKAVQTQVAQPSGGLEQYITTEPTQTEALNAHRAVSMSVYMLAGAFIFLALTGLGILFIERPE
jgi:capsular polysaccharide biosynthesis protein